MPLTKRPVGHCSPPGREGRQNQARCRHSQRGLSLVELMVGIAVGMFVVAAATFVVATQLTDNRRLMLEVQLQQNLRAATEVIARDLRRAGAWPSWIASGSNSVAVDGALALPNTNLTGWTLSTGDESTVQFKTSRTPGSDGPYGFALEDGVIMSWLVTGQAPVPLTDAAVMRVTLFRVTRDDEPGIRISCPVTCDPAGSPVLGDVQYCWPTLTVRRFRFEIEAVSTSDPNVRRSVTSEVRLRTDAVDFHDPIDPSRACPR